MNSPSHQGGDRNTLLTTFYVLLALGTLAHEMNWLFKIYLVRDYGLLWNYYEPYRLLLPLLEFPNWVAFAAHALLLLGIGLMMSGPRRDFWATAMFPVIVLNFLVQGTKPANHLAVLVFIYFAHAMFFTMECWSRRDRREDLQQQVKNDRFLQVSAIAIIVATYSFAVLAKLNWDFLDPRGTASARFVHVAFLPLYGFIKPLLGGGNGFYASWMYGCGVIGIPMTLFMEAVIPVCAVIPKFRRFAVTIGLWFHLPIVASTAIDFSMTMIALYPFLIAPDLKVVIRDHIARPTRFTVLVACLSALFLSAGSLQETLRFHRLPSIIELFRLPVTFFVAYLAACMLQFLRASVGRRTAV